MFAARERRLRDCTSFFISNLPDGCNRDRLWKAFGHLDVLEDVFVPNKRDGAGNKFGFLKLFRIRDVNYWIATLKEVRIDGAVINVELAKFNRDGSKAERLLEGERVSVFSRLNREAPVIPIVRGAEQEPMRQFGEGAKSYRAVVMNQGFPTKENGQSIELPPVNTETKKCLEFKSLVGETKDIDILNNLKETLHEGLKIRYLGGLKVLISFNSVQEADEYLRTRVEEWEHFFSRLYMWEGVPPVFERVAWVKIMGIPISLWDRHIINKVGERCGRLLVNSDASPADGNMSEDRVAILVHSGKRISKEFSMRWKEHTFQVWVEEISGQWCPAFLDSSQPEDDAEVSSEFNSVSSGLRSPISPPEEEKSNDVREANPFVPLEGSPDVCMEKRRSPRSPKTHAADFSRDNDVEADLSEERENMAHINDDSGENPGSHGLGPEPSRPSYITLRPKLKTKPKQIKSKEPLIPDLNEAEVENLEAAEVENSDPFNIEEIFRLEKNHVRGEEELCRSSSHPESGGNNLDSEQVEDGFESEVAKTMELGEKLGIEVTGFGSWVRRLKCKVRADVIGLQETHKSELSEVFLRKFWDSSKLKAVSVNSVGRSGGLTLMWNPDIFCDEVTVKNHRFLLVSGKVSKVAERVNLVNIHAPNDASLRRALWSEISELFSQFDGVWILFGDFNEVRSADERVNSRFDSGAAEEFNGFISRLGLLEYPMTGGKFTFISGHSEVKLSKLDRFLVNDSFMSMWPSIKVEVHPRGLSDHCPISLSCNATDFGPIPFKFFNTWVRDHKVVGIVKSVLAADPGGDKADAVLSLVLKQIKGEIKKWRKQVFQEENSEALEMSKIIEEIEFKASTGPVSNEDKNRRMILRLKLLDMERIKVKNLQQKARANWAKFGDENSSFFHKLLNVNIASSRINGLCFDNKTISDPVELKLEIKQWFKKFFSEPIRRRPKFCGEGLPRLSDCHIQSLSAQFSEQEVLLAIKSCDGGKAPGPDGFTLKFFKSFWEDFKDLIMRAMRDFYFSGSISKGCNSSFVALIPKIRDPEVITDFRPISLVGSAYKILSKVLANRLKAVLDEVISKTQSAFVGGRNILDGPLIVSETVAWAKKTKQIYLFSKSTSKRRMILSTGSFSSK
ncbi:putative RNA-directed DNA polymerase [Helianthus annuus]|nr:putative RNA-directed DNA polymerase [Helianthus annuus]